MELNQTNCSQRAMNVFCLTLKVFTNIESSLVVPYKSHLAIPIIVLHSTMHIYLSVKKQQQIMRFNSLLRVILAFSSFKTSCGYSRNMVRIVCNHIERSRSYFYSSRDVELIKVIIITYDSGLNVNNNCVEF